MGLTIDQAEVLINEGWETFSDQTFVNIESLADALLRADAAEKQLAEVQERRAELERLLDIRTVTSGRLAEAHTRIAQLERLVPGAELLLELMRDNYTAADMKRVLELRDSIIEYREAECSPR